MAAHHGGASKRHKYKANHGRNAASIDQKYTQALCCTVRVFIVVNKWFRSKEGEHQHGNKQNKEETIYENSP
jgi:hypothetical protein